MEKPKNTNKQNAGEPPALPGYHTRGYLPHIEGAEYQMITYRLADALPKEVLIKLSKEKDTKKRRKKIEEYIDAGHGNCWLKRIEISKIVTDNWHYFDNKKYQLIAYVVMPNHVHVLVKVFEGVSLSSIVHSWKSYTAKKVIEHLSSDDDIAGEPPALPLQPLWQAEYWDRYIRNQKHFDAAINYIHQNPIKAGLNIKSWEAGMGARYWERGRLACKIIENH